MVHNKPLPKFAQRGQQTGMKSFKERRVSCLIYVPKPIELDGEVPNEKVQSKWLLLKEKKLNFSKSAADIKVAKIWGEESEEESIKVVKLEYKDMDIQVGASLCPELFNIATTKENSDDGSPFDTQGKSFELEDEEKEEEQVKKKAPRKKFFKTAK